jgi:hypothetical protein
MYIDPNTGGVIFGWLLGAFGLVTGLLLVFSGKIRGFIAQLRRKTRQKDETEDPD